MNFICEISSIPVTLPGSHYLFLSSVPLIHNCSREDIFPFIVWPNTDLGVSGEPFYSSSQFARSLSIRKLFTVGVFTLSFYRCLVIGECVQFSVFSDGDLIFFEITD